jgi:hypothetical protein
VVGSISLFAIPGPKWSWTRHVQLHCFMLAFHKILLSSPLLSWTPRLLLYCFMLAFRKLLLSSTLSSWIRHVLLYCFMLAFHKLLLSSPLSSWTRYVLCWLSVRYCYLVVSFKVRRLGFFWEINFGCRGLINKLVLIKIPDIYPLWDVAVHRAVIITHPTLPLSWYFFGLLESEAAGITIET